MINNIENLFAKYKEKIVLKKDLEEKVLNIFLENGFKINKNNLKIDQKNKKLELINLNSTNRFYLKSKINQDFTDKIKEYSDLNLKF